jgi:hypothetical protein
MSVPFFSQAWCDAAKDACNTSEVMYKGFKDPATFTNRMAFGVLGRDDLVTHLEWKEARIITWTPPQFPESDLWLVINASLDTWRKAAEGGSEGGKLLMAGKIKFAKGPMSAAIENAAAFNNFLLSWGKADTDWNV